ncbi:EutN/CcmL family microcompartment protein [Chachezhania sediminis]|uniref:EutN/CcmL family microcompartment protein n=1 Tax=Chachezhania sediminis TaxID=2599291 RepID=UPI00131BF90F|nr:EutN/CcmL family microcompartment protein [Chachezhania sediminis]
MKLGTVTGRVWATKRLDRLPPGALLLIALDGSEETIVAFDTLGCGDGERVIVSEDDGAADLILGQDTVIDALIVGIVDTQS